MNQSKHATNSNPPQFGGFSNAATLTAAETLCSDRDTWDVIRDRWLTDSTFSLAVGRSVIFASEILLKCEEATVVRKIQRVCKSGDAYEFQWEVLASDRTLHLAKDSELSQPPYVPWAIFKSLFKTKLQGFGINVDEVDWQEVAEQFSKSNDPGPRQAQTTKQDDTQVDVGEEIDSNARAIDPDVLAVLREGNCNGTNYFLPPRQLDRKLYERTNAVLTELGGKWKSGKTKAHVFDIPAEEALYAALATGHYVNSKDFGFFPTPENLARQAVKLACLMPGMIVLEPSAGRGALALEAAKIVGQDNVYCYDLLTSHAETLREAGFKNTTQGDFLKAEPVRRFDAVVMNPPFGRLQDIAHVERAARLLEPDGVLVAIMGPGFKYRSTAAATRFREFAQDCGARIDDIEAGAFKSAGTNVASVMVRMEAKNFPWNKDAQAQADDLTDMSDSNDLLPIERMRA
ncbi:MAG: hypothetical protein EPN79_11670 [Burkholderiaceae bacterium]|nr:MAG: hypothetical protein EPN79_11670 [Burkholderiaceae bacterium]TBR76685.1 MAG: hypothetical protein EPN64_05395 [Burkholderiaceae bacterium]